MILSISFFSVALIYSMVGFGGGSSYLAILSFTKASQNEIVILALIANILVVSSSSYNFFKKGHYNRNLLLPLCFTSIPMAFVGGSLKLKVEFFYNLLAFSLVLASIFLFLNSNDNKEEIQKPNITILILMGAALGLLSGMVGIGGGIFLMPLLVALKFGKTKEIAHTSSVFILVNSLSGLFGQVTKIHTSELFLLLSIHWLLFLAVFFGGQFGSRFGSHDAFLKSWIKKVTSLIIMYAGLRILYQH